MSNPVIAISYRREDSVAVAGRLYDSSSPLADRSFHGLDSIPPGSIRAYHCDIERSQLIIALIGRMACEEEVLPIYDNDDVGR